MSNPDPEMLRNLGLLLDYEELQNSSLWDDFVKNFDQVMQDSDEDGLNEDGELSLESEVKK